MNLSGMNLSGLFLSALTSAGDGDHEEAIATVAVDAGGRSGARSSCLLVHHQSPHTETQVVYDTTQVKSTMSGCLQRGG